MPIMRRPSKVTSTLKRNLATAAMSDVQTAVYKATAEDKRPPKEKHLSAIVGFAGSRATADDLAHELAKRLQGSRAAKSAEVAAKGLVAFHRVTVGGSAGVLSEPRFCVKAMAVVSSTERRSVEAEYVTQYAGYLDALCGWEDAGRLRSGGAIPTWRSKPATSLLRELPRLQQMVAIALQAAERLPVANASLGMLRLGICEDAFDLFRCEAAAAAALQSELLRLPEAAVTSQTGALTLLDTFAAHTRRVHSLQRSLRSEAVGAFPPLGIERVVKHSLPWSESGGGSRGGEAQQASVSYDTLPQRQLVGLAAERTQLMRFTLGSLPPPAAAKVCARLSLPHAAALTDAALLPVSVDALMEAVRDVRETAEADAEAASIVPRLFLGGLGGGAGSATPAPVDVVGVRRIPSSGIESPRESPRDGSCSAVEEEDTVTLASTGAILGALPVAPPVLQPVLPHDMVDDDLRIAAYETLLLSMTAPRPPPRADAPSSERSDADLLQAVRTRLNLSLRQHRRLVPLLADGGAASEVRTAGALAGSPAHRALLLIHACSSKPRESAATERPSGMDGGSTRHSSPRTSASRSSAGGADANASPAADAAGFARRQLLLLKNALEMRGFPAEAIGRLDTQVTGILRRHVDPGEDADADADDAVDWQDSDSKSVMEDLTLLRGTLIELGVLDHTGTASHWPFALAFRLYCELLAAVFDADHPGNLVEDSNRFFATFRRLTRDGPLHIGEQGEQLAMLTVCFERYHSEGAPHLLPVMLSVVHAACESSIEDESRGTEPPPVGRELDSSHGSEAHARSLLSQRRNEVLAGIAANLANRLRDYRAHFSLDAEEMSLAVQLWRVSVLQLQPRAESLSMGVLVEQSDSDPRIGDMMAAAEANAQARLEEQAVALIEASVSRNMRRVRAALAASPPRAASSRTTGGASGMSPRGQAADAADGVDAAAAAAASQRLVALAAALSDEFEAENIFAQCFDCCLSATQLQALPDGSRPQQPPINPSGFAVALRSFGREMRSELRECVAFRTVEAFALAALQALAPLVRQIREACGESLLPELEQLGEQMASGWYSRLDGELRKSLEQAFNLEQWVPISDKVLRTSSAVDIFTQLDQTAQVFTDFSQQVELSRATNEAFIDILQQQVRSYVQRLQSTCAPLPGSVLQAGIDWHGTVGSRLVSTSAASASASASQRSISARRRVSSLTRRGSGSHNKKNTGLTPAPRDPALDEQTLGQLCLRLNNMDWAGQQLRSALDKLRAALPALQQLAMPDLQWVDRACRDVIDYIAAKQVYYEMESHLLLRLYVPSPTAEAARIAPLLRDQLNPMLRVIVGTASARWVQELVMGMLGAVTHALGSVLEMPRGFKEEHRSVLQEDLRQLSAFFQDGGILDQQIVISSMGPLDLLVEEACDSSRH